MNGVRTAILIGGPQDGMACRVVLGQINVLVPAIPDRALVATYDPTTPTAYEPFPVARYDLQRMHWPPGIETEVQFYTYVGTVE